ncbi:MAG: CHAD domain-containing protein [Bacteroidetes bacterium]|nr:CHAD domain-containing protein [Bacteroidota bacterium]
MNKSNPAGQETAGKSGPADRFRAEWESVLTHLDEARLSAHRDSVHQLRVGIRQIMAHLNLIGSSESFRLLSVLKTWMKKPGKIRDIQVQRRVILQYVNEFPVLLDFDAFLEAEEKKLCGISWLPSRKTVNLTDQAMKMVIPEIEQSEISGDYLIWNRQLISVLQDMTRGMQKINFNDPESLHDFRLVVKRSKYACFVLNEKYPVDPWVLEKLTDWQKKLGKIQDLDVLLKNVEQFASGNKDRLKNFRQIIRFFRLRQAEGIESFKEQVRR